MALIQLIGEEFDARKLAVESDGTLRLPGWMALRCPTAERSAQQSATTVRTGYGPNAARAFSRDGVTRGLLVEPGAMNLIDERDLTAWGTLGTTPVLSSATTPAGASETVEVEDDDGGAVEGLELSIAAYAAGDYSLSSWSQVLAPTPTTRAVAPMLFETSGGVELLAVAPTAVDAAWAYRSDSAALGASTAPAVYVIPREATAADTGAVRAWGLQLEARGYPTSFVETARAPDVLRVEPTVLAPGGLLPARELIWRPHFAHTETAGFDHNLVYLDDDNRLYFLEVGGLASLRLRIGGQEIGRNLTFSRHQELTITIEHTAERRLLVVEGATTGDGFVSDVPLDPVELPPYAYLLGTSAGAEEGSDLVALLYSGPDDATFCDLASTERPLVQMNDSPPPGGSKFRDLLCLLTEQHAEFFDVCTAIKNALGLDTAEGAQLDLIGAVVGLPREGFTDTRYRTFLAIQVALLLSAARDDAEWTGTVENIIGIARTFIGSGVVDPIVYTGHPPYQYELSVPGLVLSEAELLARFLTTANYAGVNGLMIIEIAADVWDSAVTPIAAAGVWDSAVAPLAGALTWQIVVET